MCDIVTRYNEETPFSFFLADLSSERAALKQLV